jgi:hypothetical protein
MYATDTILQVVQDISVQIGLDSPSVAVNSSDTKVDQIMRLVMAAGNDLAGEHSWSMLRNIKTFPGIASQIQTGQPPADFDRFTPNTYLWDVGMRRPVIGALNSDEWLMVTVQAVTAVQKYWSMQQGVINILAAPAVTDSFRYEYVSKNWIRPINEITNVNDKARFTIDTDFPIIPSDLLTLSVVWRWKQSKGLDYAEDMATFEGAKEKMIGDDRGPHGVSTTQAFLGKYPDNYWPGVIST